eukprot:5038306-Prymnesium_polylepis.1
MEPALAETAPARADKSPRALMSSEHVDDDWRSCPRTDSGRSRTPLLSSARPSSSDSRLVRRNPATPFCRCLVLCHAELPAGLSNDSDDSLRTCGRLLPLESLGCASNPGTDCDEALGGRPPGSASGSGGTAAACLPVAACLPRLEGSAASLPASLPTILHNSPDVT